MVDEVPSEDQKPIPIYWMPGMAASSKIFEHIRLPENQFQNHFLDWELPEPGMDLSAYAAKCAANIPEGSVLIGVSLGGVLVQEMAAFCKPRQVIIISSIKSKKELPPKMWFARYTSAHRLLPTQLINRLDWVARYAFGEAVEKRLKLYERYLGLADKRHLDWGIHELVNWSREEPIPGLVHIHGTKDAVFPIQHLGEYYSVEGATHTLVIHRAKWLNERLPDLILKENRGKMVSSRTD